MKRTGILFIFFITLLFSICCDNANARLGTTTAADFLVEIAEKHFENGQYEEAIHEFQKALMINPDHPVALEYLESMEVGIGGPSTDSTHSAQMAKMGRIIYKQKGEIEYLKSLDNENQRLRFFNKKMATKNRNSLEENARLNAEIDMLQYDLSAAQKRQIQNVNAIANYYKDEVALNDPSSIDAENLKARYYQSLQTALLHAEETLAMADDNVKMRNYINDQYAHQDKIIRVLEEYVDLHQQLMDRMDHQLDIARLHEAKIELRRLMQNAESLGVTREHRARLDMLNQKIEELGVIHRN